MKPILSEELYAFFGMVILGVFIGVIFDILRSFRRVLIKSSIAVNISDIVFWFLAFFVSFRALYNFCDGRLRIFLVIASFLGLLLYFLTISNAIRYAICVILRIFLKIIKFIFKILLTPARFLYKILVMMSLWIFRKVKKILELIKRKKVKKRGLHNGDEGCEKQKNSGFNLGGFSCCGIFINKRRNAATKNNRKQRKNRRTKRTDSLAGTKA